jgi:PKD repeat protein
VGIVAAINGSQFVVNHVPLTEGANTITVATVDTVKNSTSTSITENAVTTGAHVTLTANTESGVAPLTVNFSASTSIPNVVTTYKIDYDGDETDDYTGPTFDNISRGMWWGSVKILINHTYPVDSQCSDDLL